MVSLSPVPSAAASRASWTTGAQPRQQRSQQQQQIQQQQQLQHPAQKHRWQQQQQQWQQDAAPAPAVPRHSYTQQQHQQQQHQEEQQQKQQRSRGSRFTGRRAPLRFAALSLVWFFCCSSSSDSTAAAAPAPPAAAATIPVELFSAKASQHLRFVFPHRALSLQEPAVSQNAESEKVLVDAEAANAADTPVALLQQHKTPVEAALQEVTKTFTPLLQHLPGRVTVGATAAVEAATAAAAADRISLALSLPLCLLNFGELNTRIGAGSFGEVFPFAKGPLEGGPCREMLAAAMAAAAEGTQGKYGVKIFRNEAIVHSLEAAMAGRTSYTPAALNNAQKVIRSIDLSDGLLRSAIQEALGSESPIAQLQQLQQQQLSGAAFVANHRSIEAAINANLYLGDLKLTGLILHRVLEVIKTMHPTLYKSIEGASPGDKASLLAAAGEKFGWAVPFGRVLVKDKNGRQLWGLLLKIYDGDIDVRISLKDDGSKLDVWSEPAGAPKGAAAKTPAAARNAYLKKVANDRNSLLSVSAKMLSPIVYMHNYFSFGHFDIKPANMLFEKNHDTNIVVTDFGMVAELGQTVPFRGTVPFLAPEMEKEKEPPSPSKAETPGSMAVPRRRSSLRLRALPAHDVFALGLTLASVWFMSASSAVTFLWVDRCIRPYLLPGVRFTFDTLRSDVGPQVYTSHVRRHLSRCMSPGGKVDKLYLPSMPLLAKLKIKQMTESNHLIRISASNAFAFIAVAHALEKVRDRPPEEAQQLLRQAEGTVLLRLSLSKAGGDRIQVGTVKGKQQITDTLRALLELASWSPLREAVESVVAPVAEDAAVQLAKLPEAAAAEVTEAQDKLQQLLQWPQLQQQEGQMKDKTYADLIDAVLGVDLEGLNALTQQEITNRKLSVVNVSIAKSAQEYIQQQLDIDPYTQLIEETPAEQAVTIILKSVGIKDEGESEILTYFKERVFASYVAWASADRLVRLAVRRCASTDPAGVSVHQKYTAGEVVDAEEQQQARRCVWGQVTQITNETHYGLPWGVSAALSDFGSPEEQVSAVVRDVFTPLHMQSAWQTENALSLLQVQVARAVSRLCAVSIAVTSSEKPPAAAAATALPEAANLRSMYRTVLMEMQKDFIVPFAFGYEQERPEYTEVLFNLSLLEFKKAIIFAAAKKQLSVVAQETLQAMGTKQRSLATLSTLLPLLPESILTWQRYASDANEAQKVINETVENEIKAIKTPQPSDLVSLWISINGAFIRSPETNKQKGRPVMKEIQLQPRTTVAQFNEHFTQVLRSSSMAPGCKSYSAVLKRKEPDGKYTQVEETTQLLGGREQSDKLRLFAMPPPEGSNIRRLNNCFFWTPQFLLPEPYIVRNIISSPE